MMQRPVGEHKRLPGPAGHFFCCPSGTSLDLLFVAHSFREKVSPTARSQAIPQDGEVRLNLERQPLSARRVVDVIRSIGRSLNQEICKQLGQERKIIRGNGNDLAPFLVCTRCGGRRNHGSLGRL